MKHIRTYENKIDGVAASVSQRPDGKFVCKVYDMDCGETYITVIFSTLELATAAALQAVSCEELLPL
jgi:hypothetical protein